MQQHHVRMAAFVRSTFCSTVNVHFGSKYRVTSNIQGQTVTEQRAIVQEDDVCVHVVGLPSSLTPEAAFGGVYGVAKKTVAWAVPNSNFELFVTDLQFYHRDQLIPIESPLRDIGINYHDKLRLIVDRREIV